MRGRDGFTLLEALVAVTLLAVVVTFALGGLRLGARSWEAGNQRLEHVSAFHTTYRFLRQSLSQAFPATMGREGDLRYAFRGDAQELRFVVNDPTRAGMPGASVVALRVVSAAGGRELRVVVAPFRPKARDLDVRTANAEDEGLLISGAQDIGFAYFGARRPGDSPRWAPSWDAPDNMPLLVRLDVKDATSGWPELVFPVAITMDTDCIVMAPPELRKCRLDEAVRR